MSGPKCYSVRVFDSDLNSIFKLQSDIQLLVDQLRKCVISDPDNGVSINCNTFFKTNQGHISQLMSTIDIPKSGDVSLSVHRRFKQLLRDRIEKLRQFTKTLENEKQNFANKERDYRCYLEYRQFCEDCHQGFDSFKTKIIAYLKKYIRTDYPDLFSEANQSISNIHLNFSKANFELGFRNKKEIMTQEIKNLVNGFENEIHKIRGSASDCILKELSSKEMDHSVSSIIRGRKVEQADQQTQKYVKKISAFIDSVECPIRQSDYNARINKLKESNTFHDKYYYIELLEELRSIEKSVKFKEQIKREIVQLNKQECAATFKGDTNALLKKGTALISKDRIKSFEFNDFKTSVALLLQKNKDAIQKMHIKKLQRSYIKKQIVQQLKGLNYQVVNDMKVIDFEKESYFLFHVPNQKNYINLRFNKDGTFRYNFLIPEQRDKLNIEKKAQKIAEMESTCSQFKQVLTELTTLGLKIDLENELPTSEKFLVQVPSTLKDKLKKATQSTESQNVVKRKYLYP